MKTEQVVFNIIWLDDQIDDLYKTYKNGLRDAHIKVLGKGAHDVEEFEHQMQKYKYAVDAVVTDANFNKKVKDDFDGLLDVSYLIKKYNKERPIPFLVFSGRDNLVDTVNKRTLDQFDGRFEKQKGISPLIVAIKEFVLKVNSKEFRIRNKYKDELAAASLIKGNEETLMNALLYDYADNWKNTEDYFNPIRKIAERILEECKKMNIIPRGIKLSGWPRFLMNKDYIFYYHEEIMPKPLIHCLEFLLNITQDGSHDGNLELGVDSYVRNSKNINLFRSVLYIAMDLCLWFEDRKNKYVSECKEKINWGVKNESFICLGEVYMQTGSDGRRVFVCENYLLGEPKNGEYSEGDIIGIIRETSNKYPFKYIKKDGTEINVEKYAIVKDIVILS